MKNLDYRTKTVIFLMYSSVILGKAFVYVGLAVGATFLIENKMLWRRWYGALTQRGNPTGSFAWALLVSILYGAAQVIRGYFLDYPVSTALQIFVFNLCPIYIFSGLWAGERAPWIMPQYIRIMAWYSVVYAILYILVFSHLNISLPGTAPGSGFELLGRPRSGSMVIVGLIAYEPSLARFWLPLIVLCCITLANQERGDWLGFVVALTVWGILARKMGRLVVIGTALASILLIAYLVDFRVPGFADRGGELSARDTVARMAGSVSPELAQEVGASASNSRFYYGTVYWRKHWWAQIRDEVTSDTGKLVFGLGYGYPLAALAGPEVEATGTRTPHNILYFAFGYSGLVGVAIFIWLQLSLLKMLWGAFKVTGETYALAYFCYVMLQALFGNFIETPQVAMSVYLSLGLMIGQGLMQMESGIPHYANTLPAYGNSAGAPLFGSRSM